MVLLTDFLPGQFLHDIFLAETFGLFFFILVHSKVREKSWTLLLPRSGREIKIAWLEEIESVNALPRTRWAKRSHHLVKVSLLRIGFGLSLLRGGLGGLLPGATSHL